MLSSYSLELVKKVKLSMVLTLHWLSPGILSETNSFKKCMKNLRFKMLSREIQNLSLKFKFCISKNMARFSKVSRLRPCFSKCKILHLETDFVFTRDMSTHENQFPLKIHQFCILTFQFSWVNHSDICFSMQKINDYPQKIPYLIEISKN